eukprot:m.68630 g.68630  ORF g.68630 m.68630 type:complete len:69 (+) comp16008_c0_seq1:188-394(+)
MDRKFVKPRACIHLSPEDHLFGISKDDLCCSKNLTFPHQVTTNYIATFITKGYVDMARLRFRRNGAYE